MHLELLEVRLNLSKVLDTLLVLKHIFTQCPHLIQEPLLPGLSSLVAFWAWGGFFGCIKGVRKGVRELSLFAIDLLFVSGVSRDVNLGDHVPFDTADHSIAELLVFLHDQILVLGFFPSFLGTFPIHLISLLEVALILLEVQCKRDIESGVMTSNTLFLHQLIKLLLVSHHLNVLDPRSYVLSKLSAPIVLWVSGVAQELLQAPEMFGFPPSTLKLPIAYVESTSTYLSWASISPLSTRSTTYFFSLQSFKRLIHLLLLDCSTSNSALSNGGHSLPHYYWILDFFLRFHKFNLNYNQFTFN